MNEQTRTPSSGDRGAGDELPDPAETPLVNANVAIPVNAELAANVLSSEVDASPQSPQDPSSSPPK